MPIQLNAQPLADFDQPIDMLQDCHRRIESFLRILQAVVLAGTNDGRMTEDAATALQTALHYFRHAAPRHTADEEESLFPRLRDTSDPRVAQVLDQLERLEHDHEHATSLHEVVDEMGTRWLQTGHLDRDERATLGSTLTKLRAIYTEHIALEDTVVFHVAREVLDDDAIDGLGREMRARRTH